MPTPSPWTKGQELITVQGHRGTGLVDRHARTGRFSGNAAATLGNASARKGCLVGLQKFDTHWWRRLRTAGLQTGGEEDGDGFVENHFPRRYARRNRRLYFKESIILAEFCQGRIPSGSYTDCQGELPLAPSPWKKGTDSGATFTVHLGAPHRGPTFKGLVHIHATNRASPCRLGATLGVDLEAHVKRNCQRRWTTRKFDKRPWWRLDCNCWAAGTGGGELGGVSWAIARYSSSSSLRIHGGNWLGRWIGHTGLVRLADTWATHHPERHGGTW